MPQVYSEFKEYLSNFEIFKVMKIHIHNQI